MSNQKARLQRLEKRQPQQPLTWKDFIQIDAAGVPATDEQRARIEALRQVTR